VFSSVYYVSVWLLGLGFLAGAACKNSVMASGKGSLISILTFAFALISVLILARYNISFSSGEDDSIGFDVQVRLMKAFRTRAQKRAILSEKLCNDRYARRSSGVADHDSARRPS
jgi:hypothetical protein